jgi:hypothetical protein
MKSGTLRAVTFVLTLGLISACTASTRTVASGNPKLVQHEQATAEVAGGLLEDTSRLAMQAGAGRLSVVAFGAGTSGDAVAGFIYVPKGRCALLFARTSQSIEDVDLAIYGDDGTQFAVDEAPDDLPTLVVCPDKSARVYASARVAQGQGLVAIGVHDLSQNIRRQVSQAVGARNLPDVPEDLNEPWPGLAASIEEHRRQLGGRWVDSRRVALPVDSRVPTRLDLSVPAETCVDVFVLVGEGVGGLGLIARDAGDRVFARAREAGQDRSLLLCASSDDVSLSLEFRPRAGRGLAVAAISVLDGKNGHLDLRDDLPIFALGFREQSPRSDSTKPDGVLNLLVGQIKSWNFHSNGCSRLDLKPNGPLIGVEAQAWSASGESQGRTSSVFASPLFVCSTGKIRLDLEATGLAGEVNIVQRPLRDASKALIQEPLASRRLLGRLHAEGLPAPLTSGDLELVALGADRLFQRSLAVHAGQCLRLAAAIGAGGYGVQARLLDPTRGLEVEFHRSAHSVFIETCVESKVDQTFTLELKTTTGSAPAWLTWTETPLTTN